MDGVRVFHDERVGYRWLDSDALDIWCQEEPTLRTSRQIWADFERRGCGQQDASFPGFQLWGKEIRCYRVHVRKATTPGKNKASKDAVSLKVGWGSDESNLHPGRWDTTSLCISGCGTTCHGGYGRPWYYVGDRYGKYKPYFEAGYTIETGVRLNQKGTIDIYYRVNDGYAGWDVASPQATLESGAAFTIPWKGGESLLPSVAGGINFGPEWEVTVDFNCSPDFKELLGISSPLAPPAKRQRLDDASSSDARKKCAECGEEGGPEAKFCSQCGHRFDNSTDVEVISFTLDGEEVLFNEDDWEEFGRIVCERARAMDVKREDGYQKRSDVVEVNLDQVRCLQTNISRCFRNGQPIHGLIEKLEKRDVHPRHTDWLILRIAKACWYDRAQRCSIEKYYTFDHRRLWCLWKTGFTKVRARIEFDGPLFNEFMRKAASSFEGTHPKDLRIGDRKSVV